MALSKEKYDFVNFVEQQYFLLGSVPGVPETARKFGVTEGRAKGLYSDKDVLTALTERGITLKGSEGKPSDGLFTAEQIAYVNAILDPADTRTRKKVLADLGLRSQTVQAWSADPAFQNYLRERAEGILPNAVSEAHIALVDNVMRGDMKAIQMVYEMSGRWSSKTVGELNVEFLMQKIIEILTSELAHDPMALSRIGEKLANLAGGTPVSPQAVGASPTLRVIDP